MSTEERRDQNDQTDIRITVNSILDEIVGLYTEGEQVQEHTLWYDDEKPVEPEEISIDDVYEKIEQGLLQIYRNFTDSLDEVITLTCSQFDKSYKRDESFVRTEEKLLTEIEIDIIKNKERKKHEDKLDKEKYRLTNVEVATIGEALGYMFLPDSKISSLDLTISPKEIREYSGNHPVSFLTTAVRVPNVTVQYLPNKTNSNTGERAPELTHRCRWTVLREMVIGEEKTLNDLSLFGDLDYEQYRYLNNVYFYKDGSNEVHNEVEMQFFTLNRMRRNLNKRYERNEFTMEDVRLLKAIYEVLKNRMNKQ
jgi:hypothetical protein